MMVNINYCHCERQPKAKAKQSLRLLRALRALAMTIICAFTVVCGLWTVDLYAQPVSSIDLINNAKEYDGKQVTYSGEVIGDIMVRGEYAWINVNDGVNAVGIWAPKGMLKDIVYKGSYNQKGDRIEIKGVFNRSCKEHGGDLDIHAGSLIKLKEGYPVKESPHQNKMRYAVLFGAILVIVSIWKIYKKFIGPSSGR